MASRIHKVGVIGIGLMGSGIAQVAATQGFDTVVVDVTGEMLARGRQRIEESLQRLTASYEKTGGKSGISPEEKGSVLSRLSATTDRATLLQCDIVIEAIVENEQAKKELI